jgi:hypothetical protein
MTRLKAEKSYKTKGPKEIKKQKDLKELQSKRT